MARTRIRILLLEDNPADAMLLEATLAEAGAEYEVSQVERLAQGLSRLTTGSYEIVFADLSLPDSHGVDTVKQLRGAAPSMPVVVLTGLDDEEVALKAVQSGAEGYLVKWRFGTSLLTRTITHAIEHRQQVTALEEKLAVLETWKEMFTRAMELIAEGVLLVDREGTVSMVNPAASRVLGRQEGDLVGTYVGRVDENNATQVLRSIAAPGARVATDVRVVSPEWHGDRWLMVLFA